MGGDKITANIQKQLAIMKLKIILLLPFLLFSNIKVDYTAYTIIELIEKAEIIGKCTILSVDKTTFTVEFEDVIKGKPAKQLQVVKFVNWTCASRELDYKAGQTLLLFLGKNKNKWEALGAGNEGEVFIQDGAVFYRGDIRVKKDSEMYALYGKKYFGLTFSYSDVKDGIMYYLANSGTLKKMTQEEIRNFKPGNLFLEGIVDCVGRSFN